MAVSEFVCADDASGSRGLDGDGWPLGSYPLDGLAVRRRVPIVLSFIPRLKK